MDLRMQHPRRNSIAPALLLLLFCLLAIGTVFLQADVYGLTIDEPLQDAYGRSLLKWYTTFGHDQSFITGYDQALHMPEHGASFEVLVALVQHFTHEQWHTRAVVNGLAGVAGIIGMALCGLEIGGWWIALLAAISLWLYPRFFGAIFNNSKDLPFASVTCFVLWAVLLLVRSWESRKRLSLCLLVGFLIGLAASIRINAVVWYPILAVLLAGWWLLHGKKLLKERRVLPVLGSHIIAAVLLGGTSFLAMILLWPYIALDPVHNLVRAFQVMSQYPWNGTVPFAGQIYPASQLPRTFVPTWLAISSPPAMLFFAAVGCFFPCLWLLRRRKLEGRTAALLLAFGAPLAALVLMRPTLYDSIRQFLFLVPPLLLLAMLGIKCLYDVLIARAYKLAAGVLILLVLLSHALVGKEMLELHPYEYIYFNQLVGGVAGANGKYEMDYWATCTKPAIKWLGEHYAEYMPDREVIFIASPQWGQIRPFVPGNFRYRQKTPDFYLASTRFNWGRQYPDYSVIHTITIQGYDACVIKVRPTK
uniref:Glycosyltransferase RgtA/B/C/D-like domain-containing protein n=1 Tax=Thermosporothrix sp. COM3 TaxID=2490863 RepID=A0A455SHJ2_9CHLR|nr:hypothetical protein KTC_26940 [Thermosporothrix sp. COM3]